MIWRCWAGRRRVTTLICPGSKRLADKRGALPCSQFHIPCDQGSSIKVKSLNQDYMYARRLERERAMRGRRPRPRWVLEPLVPRVVRHLVPRMCHPVRPLLRLLMPPPVGCERHHHEDSTAHLHGPLAAPAPRPLHLQRGVVPRVCTKLHVHCLSARVRALLVAFPIEGTFQNYFNFKLPHTHSITPATWHNINPAGYRAVATTQI